ncbi:acetyltransferase [Massilimicrobiota timonensis]|uniref:Transferase n=1 Tax=Massilimicrobiota timonensis TaxID=1776392 RepID=A0A1Y4SXW9_9FIRM|nr:acetyltransferase [Massilimicrobiota timonensis]OUQ33623.1 transferase [Massilimicrobiota timonensis]
MKDIYIIGASDFGREVAWLLEELSEWNIKGFIDDNETIQGEKINGITVIGTVDFLLGRKEETNVVIAIGSPSVRSMIYEKLKFNNNILFPNIIAKNVRIDKTIKMGIGNIICSHSILTVNIELGNFNHVNLDCTVGHDVIMNDFITVYPSVNISGNVEIGNYCEIGTGTQIIQGKSIVDNVIIGAGAGVVKNIKESGTYVGCPVRRIK